MSVKIRLARHGKKHLAYFHVVVTDARSPRDGRIIERIGSYNPNLDPAKITLDSEKALYWLEKGAQPSDTCRRILSYEGVLLRKHLNGGITKGALTEEVADKRWNDWKVARDAKISKKLDTLTTAHAQAERDALEAETKVNNARAEVISKRKAEEAIKLQEIAAAKAAEKEANLEAAKEAVKEAPKAEAPKAKEVLKSETPKAKAPKEETKA
ncbi:MAG: 30S ribosomal protein S16 [Bacteroidales bacterium]